MNYETVSSLLYYNPDTGILTWKVSRGNVKPGYAAGSLKAEGYLAIKIYGRLYYAHRIAYLLMTGNFPPDEIDHINGVTGDNRWVNLRAVSGQENHRNTKKYSSNTSGITGVIWHKSAGKWMANIKISGKQKHIGYTEDFFEACCVRKSAELTHGYHANHGRTQ